MKDRIQLFSNEEAAATSVEYCFMAALIIFTCILGIATFGANLSDMWNSSNDAMTAAFGS